jgi:hypothetical protein
MLLVSASAGFPSPAQDDMEEPINLGEWLVEHPAASYVMLEALVEESWRPRTLFEGDGEKRARP